MTDHTYLLDTIPEGGTIGLEATPSMSAYDVPGRTTGYRLSVLITRHNDIDPNVFVHRLEAGQYGHEEPTAVFQGVATPLQLEELPAGDEGLAEGAYFRTAQIDQVYASVALRAEAWDAIKARLQELVRTLTLLTVEELVPYEVGYLPAESSSSSSSSE